MPAKTRLVIGFKDDIGTERDNMEDAAGYSMATTNMDVRRKGSIFVVADGVGGHQAGELASKRAVNAILKEYYACPYDDTESSLRFAVNQANDVIFKEAQETGKDTMATTVVCAVIRDGTLTLANVGDSRVYLLRNGMIRQLTEDHSWVNEQIRLGLLTPDQARDNPYRNVITRSLGNKPKVEIDIETPGTLLDNDLLLLCSDGMYEGVSEEVMVEVTRRLSSVQAAEELVDLAKRGGSTDNITVMIVEAHLTGESEGVPVPVEVQQPAAREAKTQPKIIVNETIEQLEEPVVKPDEPPAEMIQAAPISAPLVKEESGKNGDFDKGAIEAPEVADPQYSTNHQVTNQSTSAGAQPFIIPEIPPRNGGGASHPSSIRKFQIPMDEEPAVETTESDVSIRRPFYWEWAGEYRSFGKREPVKLEKTLKLPDGTQVTLTLKIINNYFINSITKATYNHPLAFEISANLQQQAKNLIKSKLIMGVGFYNQVKERMSLLDISKKNYEILISEDEVFLINKAKPLIFATIDLVEFENIRDHKVEQDFLTFLQIKVRFHVII